MVIIMKEYGKSIWVDTVNIKEFPKLKSDIETDILIVGGGLCGILTAYKFSKKGYNVVVVEKDRIGMGITKNTTGVVTAQHDTLYSDYIKKIGLKKAKLFLKSNLEAVEEYKKLSEVYDFDLEEVDTYMYTNNDSTSLYDEYEALKCLNFDAEFVDGINLHINCKNAVKYPKQAQINALKLIDQLSRELTIYEHSEILKFDKCYAYTKNNKIKYSKVIITTHFPFIDRLGMYYAKMHQVKSYVIAVKTNTILNEAYIGDKSGDIYLRKYKDYILIGGNDRLTGTKGMSYSNLIKYAKENYKDAKVEYKWSNQDCMTIDLIPYIGEYSILSNNMYIATGFNEWGMTSCMTASNVLLDVIEQKVTEYTKLFNPNRNMIKKDLFKNLGRYVKHLVKKSPKRCTHLGSELIWNEEEKTWECPCHGSKFTQSGEVIHNPTQQDLP